MTKHHFTTRLAWFALPILAGPAIVCAIHTRSAPASTTVTIGETVQKGEKQESSKQAAPIKLIAGERVDADDVMIFVKSTLIEEGDAVKKMAKDESNINNVRYNMNGYEIGYSIASEKKNDQTVFTGVIKGWRATGVGEVSRWPPDLYAASRKETRRQAELIEPVRPAETLDEMNNLRVYYRPLLVGHEGDKYTEDPSALAFFIHPKTAARMTVLFRGGRSYPSIKGPLVVNSKIYVKEVVPGRGKESSTLVPSIFFTKEVKLDVDPLPQGGDVDRLMQAVIDAREKPMATEDFKALFEELSRATSN